MEQRLADLKRFLDRLLSEPQRDPLQDEANMQAAAALGLTPAGTAQEPPLTPASLVEITRAAIRKLEPLRPADQSLESMSAPPAPTPPVP